MIEGGYELDVRREQHAIAKHVPGHVADSDDGEICRLSIDPQFAEVSLDRFPHTARCDPHLLVVISFRATGGKRITQPETVFLRDSVRDVGERGGALISGDHKVWV